MSGIYIHVPFCKQACHYCDFHFSTKLKKKGAMIVALQKEMELRKEEFQNEQIETIYFGGGTPSILNTEEIEGLIASVYQNYDVIGSPEITLEANPDDLMSPRAQSRGPLKAYKNAGVNRLSIGIQSFFEEDLKFMNRAHNAQEAENCIKEAQEHFQNITIDLIYGIPGMTNERWESNIEKALDFQLPHISSYALTVEPKTALKSFIEKGIVKDVDDEQAQEQFYILVDRLHKEGFVNYEISNFGRPGFFSKNNTSYWQGKKYMGIGPSAHSFDGEHRSWNVRNNTQYIKALEKNELPSEVETLSKTDRYNECVMTGLRTIWGVALEKIKADFGSNYLEYLHQQSKKHIESDLLFEKDGKLLATKKGKFLVDGIASDLFMVNLG
ncbi:MULTISPECIES: radical SAM family heme chaperone HemW [Flavobacteriaceae]|uniref:radical SAM family heme chaperone HemW n=1 Tax=Flavobacteriaceae TaxID=49546 RepID=UPI001490C124|nr:MULTISPECIES: radical SAM family heme chaperone HemW [Allomuricauda]MDC6367681.1 radical SAM family heme chaperone HemW [Muricauda sp. AC10]